MGIADTEGGSGFLLCSRCKRRVSLRQVQRRGGYCDTCHSHIHTLARRLVSPRFGYETIFDKRVWHTAASLYKQLLATGCAICYDKRGSMTDYHIDHIEAYSQGGGGDRSNLQMLCAKCN